MSRKLMVTIITFWLVSIAIFDYQTRNGFAISKIGDEQKGTLIGKVVEQDNSPLQDVLVEIVRDKGDDKFEGKTDSKGDYQLKSITPGRYTVTFSKKGYKTSSLKNIIIPLKVVTPLNTPPMVLHKEKE
jgi:hypothetical protein